MMRKHLESEPGKGANESVDAGRRGFFTVLAASPLLLMGFAGRPTAAQAQASACVDMAKLPMSERSIRNSLGFKVQTDKPDKKCGTCAFFTPSGGECGKCQLFSNGPVGANSVCNSWAKKG